MADPQRLARALRAAHEAGDTEAATRLAQALRNVQRSGPAPRDYSFLEERGLADDQRARELFDSVQDAQAAGNEEDARRNMVRLSGYLSGRDAVGDRAGGESRGENIASRAETALRGAGQGMFGIGDFAAALGSWVGEGGPMSDFSLREHFAFQRSRREGMSEQNPVSGTVGYLGGAVAGGGAIQAGVRQAALRAPGAAGSVARFAQIQPGRGRVGNVARNAAGSALASTVSAGIEEGAEANLGEAAAVGAVAGPVGERVIQAGGSLLRRGLRRFSPEAAATAQIARRAMDEGERVGTAGAERLAAQRAEIGDDAALIETLAPSRARLLGESMGQSDEALREALPNLDRIETRRAQRLGRAIQAEEAPLSADEVASREMGLRNQAMRRVRGERAEAEMGLEGERRGAVRAARAQGEEALRRGEEAVSEAERNLQARLQDVTYADDMVDPDDVRQVARQYGNERMREIANRRFEIDEQTATDLLSTRTVRNFLRDYAEDNPDARGLRDLLKAEPDEQTGAYQAFNMTLRQADSLRRAADAAGEARPEVRFRLTQLADNVEQIARNRVPEYDEFLTNFSNLMARADGAEAGFTVTGAQPSRLASRLERLTAQNRTAAVGARQAAQRAVFDEATASPSRARRIAERIAEDPRNVQATMGPRATAVRRTAEEGVENVREAERALDELRIRQRADQEELDDLFMQRRNRQTREFDERIDMIEDRMRARNEAIRRAEEVVSGDTSQFVNAVARAREVGLAEDFGSVARTRLAETAEESGRQARSVAESLANDPGLRRRVEAVFGADEAQRIFGRGAAEMRGGQAVEQAFQGVGTGLRRLAEDEQQMLLSAVDLGVLSTNRASGSFMGSAAVRVYRLVNGDQARALALVRALTDGDPQTVRNTIARLRQLGASRQFQMDLANTFGTAAAMERGQAVAGEEEL